MALEAEVLSKNYQLPLDFAQKLLNFTKNDLEAAIKILNAAEKSIAIVKGKFLTSKKLFNGGFIIAYNIESREVPYILFLVTGENSITRINIDGSWKNFYNELYQYSNGNLYNHDMSTEVQRVIQVPENLKYIINFFIDAENIDQVNLKRFITNELSKVLMDTTVAVKTSIELTDVFNFENFLNQKPIGQKIGSKNSKDLLIIVNLKVEPVLAPIGGIEIGNLEYGDEILLKIKDERDIIQFIFSMIDNAAFQAGSVYATLVSKEMDEITGNFGVRVEFAPGIYGSFVIGSKVRIQAKKRVVSSPPKTSTQKETKQALKDQKPQYDYSKYNTYTYEKKEEKFFEKSPMQTFIAVLMIVLVILLILLFFL